MDSMTAELHNSLGIPKGWWIVSWGHTTTNYSDLSWEIVARGRPYNDDICLDDIPELGLREPTIDLVGVGESPQSAVEDLKRKIDRAEQAKIRLTRSPLKIGND